MYRTGTGHQVHRCLQHVTQLNGHPQMTVMNRIEGTAKNRDQKTSLRNCESFLMLHHRSATDLAIAQHHELLGGQAFQTNRPPRVDLVGGNANFSP